MLSAIWGCVKGLFGAKGTTQMGSRNQSVSGVTTGNVAGPLALANVINYHAVPAASPKTVEFELSSEEKVLLLKMEKSKEGTLMLVPNDIGPMILVDCAEVFDINEVAARVRWYEAFEHLLELGFVKDVERNSHTYHLSSAGRTIAANIRKPPTNGDERN